MSAIRLLPVKNTLASLAIDGPAAATFNTVIEAHPTNYPGGYGNAITLSLVADGTWVACAGTLTLAGNATITAATLDLDTVTGDLDTIVAAVVEGTYGNDITVTVVGDSGAAEGVTIDEDLETLHVTIHFEDGVSTVADVETAIGAEATLIEVDTTGTGATVLDAATDECTAESLAGGANETVTVNTDVYTFQSTLQAANDVLIGATASDTIDNLIAAINGAAGEGTTYGTGTVEHTTCRAYAGAGDTMVVHSKPDVLAAAGTLFPTEETMTDGSWGATTLGNGTDGTNVTFVVTGTAIVGHYANGFSNVEDFEAELEADEDVANLVRIRTAGTTPTYLLIVGDDDFSATNLTGGGATSSAAPTLTDSTAGTAMPFACDQALLLLRNVDTVTSTTKTATGTVWGFSPATSRWYVIGAISGGSTIGETSSDAINYSELMVGLRGFSRLYFQIGALGGAGTEIEVYANCVPCEAVSH